MSEDNLFDYILKSKEKDQYLLELIKYNVINKIYYYGDHFIESKSFRKITFIKNTLLEFIYVLFFNKKNTAKLMTKGLSSCYHDRNEDLEKLNYTSERLISSPKRRHTNTFNLKLFILTKEIMWDFSFKNFNYLTGDKFIKKIKKYYELNECFIRTNNYKFLFIPNDTDFFSRLNLHIFKKMKLPTFLFMHGGMPNIYDRKMDNKTDYLVNWGMSQTNAYKKMGFDSNKLFTSGHPFYSIHPEKLKFSFQNILVLTKSLNGVCPLETTHLEDRGNAIMYLYSIMNTLKKVGVSKVRFRPHPSENENWYLKFLDLDFFVVDSDSLSNSLAKSSLVIGPTSTTIIDSMAYEVNYLVYEPLINDKTLMGYEVSPPLDGSDN